MCLTDIIGLSEVECSCFDFKPENAEDSLSGYFIDDKFDGIPLDWAKNGSDCGSGSLWELLDKARQEGVNEYKTLIEQHIYDFNNKVNSATDVVVGDSKKSNSWNPAQKNFNAIKLTPLKKAKGTVFVLSSISIHLLEEEEVTIYILKNGTEIFSEAVTATNGLGLLSFPSGFKLSLCDNFGENEFQVVIETNGNSFRNYKFNCNCSGTVNYWETIMKPESLHGDSLDSLSKSPYKGYTSGMRIAGTIKCDDTNWYCDYSKYNDTAFWRVQAKIIQLLSIEKLIGHLLSTSNINKYTGLMKEALMGKARKNRKKIDNDLMWLAINIPKNLNNCIECKDHSSMRLSTILV